MTAWTVPITPIISTALADTTVVNASTVSTVSTASTPETSASAQAFRIPVNISLAGAMSCLPGIAFPLHTDTL
ncbi:hypothetical protein ORK51_16450 [Stenotrophomonas rhizophila]|uniref:hypothetical protein n=1 Tax=Stenotrophomonas rhizophila TaxID=216778 RepID=UPI00224B4986|nr:hypothetical protein [Stenotrophomonas rhizophila]MCX2921768.1 hypothetical protein [Stenotrophomonas rhizophila]